MPQARFVREGPELKDSLDVKALIAQAIQAREYAYVPYSNYPVGAALLCRSGKVFTGCNVENASSGATCCAERTAIFKAISEGERDFVAIAVVTDSPGIGSPCGICRQVMMEFAPEMPVIMAGLTGDHRIRMATELLPDAFTKASLS